MNKSKSFLFCSVTFNILMILFLAVVSSCKPQEKKKGSGPPSYNVDPEIEMYVQSFREKMAMAGINKSTSYLQASFTDSMPPGAGGSCQVKTIEGDVTTYKVPVIKFLKTYWENLDVSEKEQVTFHELSHCLLGRAHVMTADSGGNPISIMYPSRIPGAAYRGHYSEFMTELFSDTTGAFDGIEFDDGAYNY